MRVVIDVDVFRIDCNLISEYSSNLFQRDAFCLRNDEIGKDNADGCKDDEDEVKSPSDMSKRLVS